MLNNVKDANPRCNNGQTLLYLIMRKMILRHHKPIINDGSHPINRFKFFYKKDLKKIAFEKIHNFSKKNLCRPRTGDFTTDTICTRLWGIIN